MTDIKTNNVHYDLQRTIFSLFLSYLIVEKFQHINRIIWRNIARLQRFMIGLNSGRQMHLPNVRDKLWIILRDAQQLVILCHVHFELMMSRRYTQSMF